MLRKLIIAIGAIITVIVLLSTVYCTAQITYTVPKENGSLFAEERKTATVEYVDYSAIITKAAAIVVGTLALAYIVPADLPKRKEKDMG